MSSSKPLLILAPQLYDEPGGIQTYMRRLWEIISAYGESRGRFVQCLSLADGRAEKRLHAHFVKHEEFLGCRKNKLLFLLRAIIRVIRRRNGIIITGHIREAPVAWVLKRLNLVQDYVITLHGIEAWQRVPWLMRQAARNAACIIAITPYTADVFSAQNAIPHHRFKIIPLAVAQDYIELPSQIPTSRNPLLVLTVGRLSTWDRLKGIDTLIEAVGKARQYDEKIRLMVVGSGDRMPQLKTLSAGLGLESQVTFMGMVPDEKLQELYKECDLFAMPSKKEGFGIVFLEAMRFGKPCIGGNHGGTPELITQGSDGFLVNHGDVDTLTCRLVEFSRNPQLRWKLGQEAYKKVNSNHLFPHMRDKWFTLLDELNKS